MPALTPPVLFVITGTPGSGKSSVAVELLRRSPYGLHIPVDDLREWVVSGIAHPVPIWTEETGRQFRLARQAAAATARIYLDAGFAVVIDDVITPPDAQVMFEEPPAAYPVRKVLLQPTLDVALARNAERTNKSFDTSVLRQTISSIHASNDVAEFERAGWIVVDNTHLSLEDTVEEILRRAEG